MWIDLSVSVNGETLVLDKSGAAWWPRTATLILADLHFEKGSSYARFGQFLPPYDTRATLLRVAELVARRAPVRMIALGDSFHDPFACARLSAGDFEMLQRLAASVHMLWISGNHDPHPPAALGGAVMAEWREGGLVFRHEPRPHAESGEVAGHLHPCAKVSKYGRGVRRRAFAANSSRILLPAFGAYAGGLDVSDPAISGLFGAGFHAFMLGEERVYAIPRHGIGRNDARPAARGILVPG
ncbi:MAG TPA: ligase-associated DNA damage response endonuclease PdeM [Rhizomicrobium sp.]|nr:ligase-associated DNA damage response endonuclease PdeM [Rhizomicrobium sp.]